MLPPPNGSCMDELNGDDDFLPSEFMPFLEEELLQEGQGGPNMSWFDIEGLVGDLDSAMDSKLEGLFPMHHLQQQQHHQHHQHLQQQQQHMMGGMYGAHHQQYPPSPFNSPFSPSNHAGGLTRCNSVPVGCEFQVQGRLINNYHHRMGAMRGGYMAGAGAGSPYPPPPPPQPLPPHLSHFRASYEEYHTNNLNQTKSCNRIKAGFEALIDAFRAGRGDTKERMMQEGKGKKSSKDKSSKSKKANNGAKEFMSKLKDAFTPQQQQQQKVSPMPPQAPATTNTLSRSSSLKKKGSAKKPLGTMRNSSFKKEINNSSNTSSLARSYSDGPPLKSRSSSFGSGRRYSEYTVEGAIQSLLSGSKSSSSSQSQQQGLARTASFGRHLSRELSFFSNKSIEEEGEEEEGIFRDRGSDKGSERLSNDSPVDHFGTSGRELEQSLQKQRDRWGAFHPSTAKNNGKDKEEASYNLQDITKQLFSPAAVKSSKESYAKNNMSQTAPSPLDLKKEEVGQKLVSRCLSSKW